MHKETRKKEKKGNGRKCMKRKKESIYVAIVFVYEKTLKIQPHGKKIIAYLGQDV